MPDELARTLLSEQQIRVRVADMAAEIDADYAGRDLLLIGVLKGAVMLTADLARALEHTNVEMDWTSVSSYGSGSTTSGVVRMLKEPDSDIAGRHVLLVEDTTDSGLTLAWLLENLRARGAASVEICTLLRKPELALVEVAVRYVGFDIPPEFVVGYGLDYAQRYRTLPYIAVLAPHVYATS
ncbi:MAG: hypoxanthine phosphoribosyltransferase [Pseudonocardiales bacterium]|nr:MAG: hypoxanthine phosphoribosyltransferase [Pseudonocardiales bacterium]